MNNYNYDIFLSDSSDDYPKYGDGIPLNTPTNKPQEELRWTPKEDEIGWREERQYLLRKWGPAAKQIKIKNLEKNIE